MDMKTSSINLYDSEFEEWDKRVRLGRYTSRSDYLRNHFRNPPETSRWLLRVYDRAMGDKNHNAHLLAEELAEIKATLRKEGLL